MADGPVVETTRATVSDGDGGQLFLVRTYGARPGWQIELPPAVFRIPDVVISSGQRRSYEGAQACAEQVLPLLARWRQLQEAAGDVADEIREVLARQPEPEFRRLDDEEPPF